ncbi:MAG: hypothetical protein LUC22_01350 [Prevotella sp.]|nr:hypothetical protein [Prevotella sp.]
MTDLFLSTVLRGDFGVQECILPLIIGAIGAAASIGSSIAGGIASSKASKKANKYINKELSENESWYNRRMNEDATQRADAQRILTQTEDYIKNRNRAMAGQQAVQGGTEESTAATKAQNAAALADATSQIAANAEAQKDKIEENYQTNKRELLGQKAGVEYQRAQNIASAVQGVGNAAGSLFQAAAMASGSSNAGTGTRATGVTPPATSATTGATNAATVEDYTSNPALRYRDYDLSNAGKNRINNNV